MSLLLPLKRLWKARQQAIDRQILWTVLREEAPDMETARDGFRMHMDMDPAYSLMSAEEKDAYVLTLPP